MWPKCIRMPVLSSTALRFARPPRTPPVGMLTCTDRSRRGCSGSRLEQTQAEAVVEERQVVVHAAAGRQRGSPAIGLVLKRRGNLAVRAAKPCRRQPGRARTG